MPTTTTLVSFAIASLAMVVVPGPSVVYVVARGVEYGRRAGMVSVLGLEAGSLAHLAATVAGLATVVAAVPAALDLLRWAGAGYLLWLGLRQLVRGEGECAADVSGPVRPSSRQLFRDGLLVDLLNPGTALFFLAFLPQFVDPARGPVAVQVLVLGGCYLALAVVNDSAYALVAGRLGSRLTGAASTRRRTGVATGLVYVGLAAVALLL
jgi:threonine/homoserine/homoserine lactone efflux protein